MKAALLDTQALAWTFSGTPREMAKVNEHLANLDDVFVSPISIFEIGQKVRIGKWPEMEPYVKDLEDIVIQRGGTFAPLTPAICLAASLMQWNHRDPFDRFIAATAIENRFHLVSTDAHFDSLQPRKGWLGRLW